MYFFGQRFFSEFEICSKIQSLTCVLSFTRNFKFFAKKFYQLLHHSIFGTSKHFLTSPISCIILKLFIFFVTLCCFFLFTTSSDFLTRQLQESSSPHIVRATQQVIHERSLVTNNRLDFLHSFYIVSKFCKKKSKKSFHTFPSVLKNFRPVPLPLALTEKDSHKTVEHFCCCPKSPLQLIGNHSWFEFTI